MSASPVRLSLLQALSFGSMGAVFPFLALELRGAGLGGWALAIVMTSIPVLRVAVAPVWGWVSDRAGELRWPLMLGTGLAAAGVTVLVGLPAVAAFGGALLLATGRAGTAPLIEAGCVQATADRPGAYGRIRRWGSVGFILSVLIAGIVGDQTALSPLWIGVVFGVILVGVAAGMPRGTAPPTRVPLTRALGRVLRDPALALLLVASALHFSTISLYDGFFAIHLESLGHGTTLVGIATLLGVGVEVGVLTASGWLLRRLGVAGLLVGAMALAVPRWALTAVVVDPVWLIGVQAVHGMVFGGFWIAAIALIGQRAPRDLSASAQGLMAAALGGVGAGIGNLLGSAIVSNVDTAWLFVAAAVLSTLASTVAVGTVLAARRPPPSE